MEFTNIIYLLIELTIRATVHLYQGIPADGHQQVYHVQKDMMQTIMRIPGNPGLGKTSL